MLINYLIMETYQQIGKIGGTGRAPGGSSGGGSINIFANAVEDKGKILAKGGEAQSGSGGQGGAGTVTINQLEPNLVYENETIYMDINKTYSIIDSKVTFINQNGVQTPILNRGSLKFESLDTNIITVEASGKITSKNYGVTKLKITDTTNQIDLYITVKVTRVFESIVQGFKDNNLPDGEYEIVVNGQRYDVELVNYYDNMRYSLLDRRNRKNNRSWR